MMFVTVIRHHRIVNLLTIAGFLLTAVATLQQFGTDPVQITPLILLDNYSRLFIIIAVLASVPAAMFAYDYLRRSEDLKEEYYMLLSLAALGAGVLAASNHFVSFFIGLELLSVSLFAMVGYMVRGQNKRAGTLEASVKYMILSGVSSSFLLFGVALIYMDLGVLVFTEVYEQISAGAVSGYGLIGTAMILIGLGFKLSWVPFHMWTPDVYEGAPVPVTAFLATVSKVIVFAVALRFFVQSGAYEFENVTKILGLIAALSILIGNTLALLQSNIKRLLAYSSIAHFGYLIIALIAASTLASGDRSFALEGVIFYLIAYALMTWVAFGVIAVLSAPEQGTEAETLENFTGLFWHRPLLAGLMTLALLSLVGIPLTAGFVAKFYVFTAGVVQQLWWLLLVLILGSAIGLYYYLKIILEMCKPYKGASSDAQVIAAPLENRLLLCVLGFLVLYLGIDPQVMIDGLSRAVLVLL
jgi:NADH-quinone oxidoreductase subunit N